MIPVRLPQSISGETLASAVRNAAKQLGWEVNYYSRKGLGPGSVQPIEVSRSLTMKTVLATIRGKWRTFTRTLVVETPELSDEETAQVGLEVFVQERTVLNPGAWKLFFALLATGLICMVVGGILALITVSLWYTTIFAVGLFLLLLLTAVISVLNTRSEIQLYGIEDPRFQRVEVPLKALLLETFNALGHAS